MEPGKKWVDFTIHVVSVDDDQTNQAINEDVIISPNWCDT